MGGEITGRGSPVFIGMVQECTRAYEGPGVQEAQIHMLIANCRSGSLDLLQRRKAMEFLASLL